jgi:hypothetical protein
MRLTSHLRLAGGWIDDPVVLKGDKPLLTVLEYGSHLTCPG